jgi:hypothetical protein
MWRLFRKVQGKKGKDKEEKNKTQTSSKKNNVFSINDFPERMSKINQTYPLLKEKENKTLTRIIDLIKIGRHKEARTLFDELSKIRKDIGVLENSKKVIEQTSIKISLIHDIGDALETIEPVTKEGNCQTREKVITEKKIDRSVEKEFEMKDFSKNVLKDILKKDYKDIDFESIEQIDNIFNKVMQEKDN